MAKKNDDFLKKLLATFRIEADEHLKAMAAGLLELEQAPARERWAQIVEQVFREAHSLKGAARAVNLTQVESVCQSLESVFAVWKGAQGATVARPLFDLLHEALDVLSALLAPDATATPAVATLIGRLDRAAQGAVPARAEPPPVAPAEAAPTPPVEPATIAGGRTPPVPGLVSDTVRVATAKLDAVMRQSEELLAPRLAAGQRVRELRETGAVLAAWKKVRARIRPALRAVERSLARPGNGAAAERQNLTQVLEYLDAEGVYAKTLEDRVGRLAQSAEHDRRALTGMVEGLLDDVREMHMLPFASLLEAFPRFVRELARDRGKDVGLVLQGGEIGIDRRILEAMKDPLMHMIRNCIDHGIEKPAARAEKRKPPQGTIGIAIAQQDSGKVEIRVTDDGGGIDVGKVKASARKLGLVAVAEADKPDERETLALIFQSGVSTSPIITDVSGRGLGLAIVREKVERLGGTIALETKADAGTTFRIVLPMSMATFRGVLVRAGEASFVVPALNVERVVRVADADVRTVENRETIPLDGQAVALVRLRDVLELAHAATVAAAPANVQAIVLGLDPARVAFRVDEILGEQEVLVKRLGPQLARVRNVAGACVLGTGQVVAVLNVPDLMKSAIRLGSAPRVAAAVAAPPVEAERRSVLVVEDSITSRSLLKNILEAAGYRVVTAVDGIDAYTALKTGTFDIVVSDVDMPRMNGFDLTAKVRADKRLTEMPIVLVTALESREHRERGIDVGANAYIVKSSFDQSNLLAVVQSLI